MGKQKFSVGEYTYTVEKIEVAELPDDEWIEGPPPDRELLASIGTYSIIYPIVLTEYEGELYLIDGGRRIKAARILGLDIINAQVFDEVSPFDAKAWSVILNQQRSLNPVSEYTYLKSLQEEDYERFLQVTRMNAAHVKRLMSLDNVAEPFLEGYRQGTIAEGTLFMIATLSEPRQDYLAVMLEKTGRVTQKDVREARKAQTQAVLNAADESLFGEFEPPEVSKSEYNFIVISNEGEILGPYTEFADAFHEQMEHGRGWKIMRLVEV